MRLTPWIMALMLTAPAVASAQQFDLGNDIDSYRRFLIYPHLQKGWESMQRGERDSALAEFERARDLAPANAVVALQLAEAYSHFGDDRRAEAVLREQLARTPDSLRVQVALTALLATRVAVPARDQSWPGSHESFRGESHRRRSLGCGGRDAGGPCARYPGARRGTAGRFESGAPHCEGGAAGSTNAPDRLEHGKPNACGHDTGRRRGRRQDAVRDGGRDTALR